MKPECKSVNQRLIEMRQPFYELVPVLNYEKFGAALRQLREDSGISLRGMAKILGVSAPFLSDCELGNRKLHLRHQLLFLQTCDKP